MRIADALWITCAVAACTSQGSEAAERRVDTAGRRDSVAAAAASTMSEASVIGLLVLTHQADSAVGALAATNAASADVKDFGRMILREHHALAKDAMDLARTLGFTAERPRVPPD